ncbi:MAG: hypothetical protein ACKO6N_17115, partial [Myxococcota bacterium]
LMNDAPVVISEGRAFDVDVRYLGRQPNERIEEATLRAIHLALREELGSILVRQRGQGHHHHCPADQPAGPQRHH